MQILWFTDQSCQNQTLVGGKAASLARLSAHYRVPAAFCIVFDPFTEAMPQEFQPSLQAAYHQLIAASQLGNAGVAVRSSAVAEDGMTTSFAGQHETILNVPSFPAMLHAIERCRQSASSPQALAYRQRNGLPVADRRFAVLVQPMVAAERSAVAFSRDPLNPKPETLIINACWGLGDMLVGGQITPDHFVVNRADRTILARQIAAKTAMTGLTPTGITSVAVPSAQQTMPALRDEQVIEVANLALQLEDDLGVPVDIEVAYQDEQIYLLQCRPITTLAAPLTVAPQSALQPAPALDPQWDVVWDTPADGQASWLGGRDFVLPLQQSLSLYYYQGWSKAFRLIDADGGLRARFVNGYEYRLWEWQPRQSLAITDQLARLRERDLPQRWANEWLPAIQADLTQWQQVKLGELTNEALAHHLQGMLTRQLDHWFIHAIMGDAPLSAVGRLVDWYLQRFPDAPESEPYRLVQGQANTSTEANTALWQLGKLAKALRLTDQLTTDAPELSSLPAPFQERLNDYCERFGQFTSEQQQRSLRLIRHYATQALPDPQVVLATLAAQRAAFIEEVRQRLKAEEHPEFADLLSCALTNNPLTESHNLYLDQMSDAASKRVIAEFAQRLLTYGILSAAEEINYLSVYELLQWGQALRNPLRPLIQARKQEYVYYRQLQPPSFIGQPPPPPGEERTDRFLGPGAPQPADATTIRGIGASAGVVAGRAFVADSLDEAIDLQPGDILVCRSTDPTWTPLFVLAGGLVTDFGGSLSHAAVVAREYGLPAVVGTHIATQNIATGQWVAIDGTTGIIKLS